MDMKLEIKTGTATKTVTLKGEGTIDSQQEATDALNEAGDAAAVSTYTVGGQTLTYAQVVGYMRLGSEAHPVAGVDEYFHPKGTTWDSYSNSVLKNPAIWDKRPKSKTAPAAASAVTRNEGEALTLADEAAVRAMAGLPADAKILGVQFDDLPEDTTPPYEIPAEKMKAGKHEMKVRYRGPNDTSDQIKVVPVIVNAQQAPITPPETQGRDEARAAYGVWPTLLPNVTRPALLPGVAQGPLTIGSIEVTSAVPKDSVLVVYVDGNEIGTVPLQPSSPGTDHVTSITIPASIVDGSHQIGLRIRRPGQAEVRYNDRPITIGPEKKISEVSDVKITAGSSPYRNDPLSVRVTLKAKVSQDTKVKVSVGNTTVEGIVKKDSDSADIQVWGPGGARNAGSGSFPIKVTPEGGSEFSGPSVTVQGGYTGPYTPPPPKGRREKAD